MSHCKSDRAFDILCRIQQVGSDQFTGSIGARAYYFRNICHDWSHEHCRTILTNTAELMEKGYSKILIDDYILHNISASFRRPSMDFLKLMYASGIGRTMRQWERILEASGDCQVLGN